MLFRLVCKNIFGTDCTFIEQVCQVLTYLSWFSLGTQTLTSIKPGHRDNSQELLTVA